MKSTRRSFFVFVLGATPCLLTAQGMPRMATVEPAAGKAGDLMTVSGENLDKKNVAEIYLTDGKEDVKLLVVEPQ